MSPNITIRHQNRRNLMMRAVRGGIEVYVPLWLKKDSLLAGTGYNLDWQYEHG